MAMCRSRQGYISQKGDTVRNKDEEGHDKCLLWGKLTDCFVIQSEAPFREIDMSRQNYEVELKVKYVRL